MSDEAGLLWSAIAFVGTHLLMSHPLRPPMVAALGVKAFRGVYSLVSFLTLGLMIYFYRQAGDEAPLWQLGQWAWILASLLMWFASVLLMGSFKGNPAMVGARRPSGQRSTGVFTITRHPMMWSFAIWGIVHFALVASPKAAILDGAIVILALVGAAGQDRKKARAMGAAWHEWTAQTAFVPFTRGAGNPGVFALAGGTILFLVATWLHPMPIGLWRFFG